MRRTLMAVLCGLVLAMGSVACGSDTSGSDSSNGSDGSSSSDGSGDTTQDDGSVDDTAPQAEGEGNQEAPDDSGTKAVSVKLPGLPVGGDHSVESSTLQCADVGWTTPPDFPDGVEIKVTGVGFSPEESFELSSESCPGDAPPCLSDDFRLTGDSRCSVAVAWTGQGSGTDDGGTLSLTSGEIVCAPDKVADCNAFKHELESITDLQTIELDPRPDDGGSDQTDDGTTDQGTTDGASPDDSSTDSGDPTDGSSDGTSGGSSDGSSGDGSGG